MKEIQGKSSLLAKIIFLSPCETSASREGDFGFDFGSSYRKSTVHGILFQGNFRYLAIAYLGRGLTGRPESISSALNRRTREKTTGTGVSGIKNFTILRYISFRRWIYENAGWRTSEEKIMAVKFVKLMQLCNRKPEKFRYHDLCDKPEFFLVHCKLSWVASLGTRMFCTLCTLIPRATRLNLKHPFENFKINAVIRS